MKSDYDGAWKNLLHNYLRESLELYFPAAAARIDWATKPVFLDQELRQLELTDDAGGNRVDLLVRVKLLDGDLEIVHLHIEVQSFEEKEFERRIFSCFQGVARSEGLNVVTLAILADLNPNWKPTFYEYEKLGCRVRFEFPVCKLLELLPTLDPNRFSLPGLAAVAQIEALQTSNSPDKRLATRLILARKLVEWGLDRKQLSVALRLVSWMMKLPERETLKFREKFLEFDTMSMTYPLTDLEEILIEEHKEEWLNEGRQEGLAKGLAKGLERGRQEGRQEGRREGREKGEWIGKILLLEELMGRKTTPQDDFANDTVEELKTKFRELEKEYFRATR